MKSLLFIIAVTFIIIHTHAQDATFITNLSSQVEETSGLIYLDGRIITHNDSGGEPALYELDSLTGEITRTVTVSNASNTDWEDICHDEEFIYIGDIGNNAGSRQDLRIYKISIADYLGSENTVTADTIHYSYADQTDFTPANQNTNFDAETLISYGEKLYIFTKNWIDSKTNIYSLPKEAGNYSIPRIDGFDSDGLLTGGTYNINSNVITLTGYTFFPYIIIISDFSGEDFSQGNIHRDLLSLGSDNSVQVEAITYTDRNKYLITSEKSFTGNSSMHMIETDDITGIEDLVNTSNFIYPNPVSDFFYVDIPDFKSVEIYSSDGKLHKVSFRKRVDVADLDKGVYVIKVRDKANIPLNSRLLIIN